MRSRMERYHSSELEENVRVKKNEELYDTIYNLDPLAEVEDVSNANEIDLESLKNITNRSREEFHKLEQYKRILNADDEENREEEEPQNIEEEKLYDINTILEKAKMDRESVNDKDKYRKLRNTQYNILNNLNISDTINYLEDANEKFESDKERLKNLINTITMNKKEIESVLQSTNSNDLLTDLMPIDNTIVTESVNTDNTIDNNTDNINTYQENNNIEKTVKSEKIDESFYTSSLSFTNTDFEDAKDLESAVKVNNVLIKILLFIIIVIITTVILFVVNNYIDLNIFKK